MRRRVVSGGAAPESVMAAVEWHCACNGPAELCEAFNVADEVIGRLALRAEQE